MPKLPLSPVPEQENDVGAQPPGSSSSFDVSESGSSSPDSAVGGKASPRYVAEPSESEMCHAEKTESDSEEGDHEEQTQEDTDNEEEWDTDLEIEESKKAYDPTGKAKYLEICHTYGVPPVSYFIRHMKDSELSLMHHGLGPKGVKPVALSLANNTSVLKLNLSDNWLNGDGTASVAEMLKENCYISDVDLSENRLGMKGTKALSAMLLENTTLVSLKLSGNELNDPAAKYLAGALVTNNKLVYLDLSHNAFGESAECRRCLSSLPPTLDQLHYFPPTVQCRHHACALRSKAHLLSPFHALGFSHLVFHLLNNLAAVRPLICPVHRRSLTWLLIRCSLPLYPLMRTQQELGIWAWGLPGKGAVAVAKGLAGNIFLRVVDLSYNGFGNRGAAALGEALKINNVLEELNVSNNHISLEGALCLALALKDNKTLRSLSMARNPIQSGGCIRILKAVQANPGAVLEVLDFSEIVLKEDIAGLCDAVHEIFPGLQIKHDGTRLPFRADKSKV
uniref:Uncharacterized protein n=1 Tax=Sphaerodactylus townsendi TaxID=933632 RepID=A0ACB8FXV8_9SAUR